MSRISAVLALTETMEIGDEMSTCFYGVKFIGDGILHDSPHSQLYHHNIPILPTKISSIYTSIDNSISPKIPCIWEILMGILW